MSTSAAFFVGRGTRAEFIAGCYFDGYPDWDHSGGVPHDILSSQTEQEFRATVANHMHGISNQDKETDPKRLCWKNAKGYSYVYAFFGGHVWITERGSRWFNQLIETPAPKSAPPAPVVQKGKIVFEGNIEIVCGNCHCPTKITFPQLIRLFGHNAKLSDASLYARDMGFKQVKGFGWICKECQKG